MRLKTSLILLGVGAVAGWSAWLAILFGVDPGHAAAVGILGFHLSLYLAVGSTATLAGFFVRLWFSPSRLVFRILRTALRQGVFAASVVVASLLLAANDLLVWWNVLLLLVLAVSLETFFLARYFERDRSS